MNITSSGYQLITLFNRIAPKIRNSSHLIFNETGISKFTTKNENLILNCRCQFVTDIVLIFIRKFDRPRTNKPIFYKTLFIRNRQKLFRDGCLGHNYQLHVVQSGVSAEYNCFDVGWSFGKKEKENES